MFDVYTGEHVAENKKSIAYSLTFSDSKKTLTDEEVTAIFNKVISDVEIKLNAETLMERNAGNSHTWNGKPR